MEVTSIMDNGWEWHARKALTKDSSVGVALVEKAERCESEEWQRWTFESKSFSSPPIPLDSSTIFPRNWQPDCTAELSPFDIISGWEISNNLLLGVVRGDFNLSSFDGDIEHTCPSNAFRYKERRYCSKCTTSSSSTAISLISSVAGWCHIKQFLKWITKEIAVSQYENQKEPTRRFTLILNCDRAWI